MTDNGKDCAGCKLIDELKERIEKCEVRLHTIDVNYAEIKVKLNLILGILSAIGVALAGVLINIILK